MVNKSLSKDIDRIFSADNSKTELSPGSKRRYDPIHGERKHNARIHRENAITDKSKPLPFSFSKPPKSKNGHLVIKVCSTCGKEVFVKENCIGIICSGCRTYSSLIMPMEFQ